MNRLRCGARRACQTGLAAVFFPAAALADPADYVFVPYTASGERVFAYAAGDEHDRDGSRTLQQVATLGWNPSARWFTALYGSWVAERGAHFEIDEVSWLNQWLLTDPGAGPLQVAALCEVEHRHDAAEGTGLTCGTALQLDTEQLQFNLNPLLSKDFHAQDPQPAQLSYQWQVKGLWRPAVEVGLQGFGQFGPWNHWAPLGQQSHTLGPAMFAKWPLLGQHPLQLDIAALFGVGSGSPRSVLRMRVEQPF